MILLYLNKCQCRYESEIALVKEHIHPLGETLIVRNTKYTQQYKDEAESIGVNLPFIYNPVTKHGMALVGIDNTTIKGII